MSIESAAATPIGALGRVGRVLAASNRGPVTFDENGRASRAGGGLASVLIPALAGVEHLWIAAPVDPADREVAESQKDVSVDVDGRRLYVRFVSVDADAYRRYYEDVCVARLWFAFHNCFAGNLEAAGPDADTSWAAFVEVNERVAEACVRELRDDDFLFVQDYQLALVPRLVRNALPDARIAYFHHVPWPAASGLAGIPSFWIDEIVRGIGGADGVGFQSRRWLANFRARAAQVLAIPPRLHASPARVDEQALRTAATSASVVDRAKQFQSLAGGRRLVARIERLDPVKNTLGGLRALALLLDHAPECRDDVVQVAIAYPSRSHMPEYRDYAQAVESAQEVVESRFPGHSVLLRDNDMVTALALMSVADVVAVTPLADGLNLVALEASVVNDRSAELVLSSSAGCVELIGEGSHVVDPRDAAQTANALAVALNAPLPVRAKRAELRRRAAAAATPRDWLADNVHQALVARR